MFGERILQSKLLYLTSTKCSEVPAVLVVSSLLLTRSVFEQYRIALEPHVRLTFSQALPFGQHQPYPVKDLHLAWPGSVARDLALYGFFAPVTRFVLRYTGNTASSSLPNLV